MGPFLPLFSVELEHSYFPEGRCRSLQWRASAQTAERLDRSGCLMRPTADGFIVLFDAERADALTMQAKAAGEPLRLDFLARATDPYFVNYTDAVMGSAQAALVCDSEAATPDDEDTGRWRLHAHRFAGLGELRELATDEALQQMLSPTERRVLPHVAVSIEVKPDDVALAAGQQSRRYLVRLKARATVWKYCLFGDWTEGHEGAGLQVVDLAQDCHFDDAVGERLPDGQSMLAVRSVQPIALQERPDRRFQLRRQGGQGSDKVLVKRLPLASPQHLHRETLGGEPTLVSEIYVHR
jgi:hypothetical protein